MKTPKQKLYKTAFSKDYQSYVKLISARLIEGEHYGRWLFSASFTTSDGIKKDHFLFWESELEQFCL